MFVFYSMKVRRGSRGIAPLIFNLGTRWRLVVNITPRPFYRAENPRCTFEYGTIRDAKAFFTNWRKDKSFSLMGIEHRIV